ncbi:MAG: branched-chain amino acid ABC transporter substrate-binding protein [Desulfobacteraceae bacterium]|jgi:branched-chain amino acid transport system substrate-binding protein|nr:MAG: branched-chain amino acid ABC transporter substrate-binding protein [Desulfobacteraceae bacterium]
MKIIKVASLICTVILWTVPAFSSDTIKLGVAGAHSGDLASYGIPSLNAARLVAADINAKGGVLGKKVEIMAEDDACKPEVAANVASKLVAQDVNLVLGHICSGATKAALNIYKDSSKLAMSPSATNVDLTKSGLYPNFFRTISPDDAQALLQVEFALSKLKVKKIAVIHDKGDYGKGLAEFAKGFFEKKGIPPVLFEGITPGAVDYSAIVQKIKFSGADAVLYGGYHPEAAKIVSTMKKKKMKVIFISDDGVRDDTFIKVAGQYAEGVYATGPIDTTRNPMAITAIEKHRKEYGAEPGAFFLNAYAAAVCLLGAIEKAGSTDSSSVSKILRSNWFDTPLGKIGFDGNGDARGIGFAMYQVQKGRYVEVVK